ncbi:MAG TPA: hypothetical protein VI489_05365, partial [Candidatus Brocadiaceae bacterium]
DSTCFDSSGYIKLNVNPACFKPETATPPAGNLFDVLSELPASQINQLVNDALLGGSPNPLFVNSFYLSQQPVVKTTVSRAESILRGDSTLRTSVKENEDVAISDINLSEIVNQAVKGKRPIIRRNLWGRPVIHFMPRPKTPKPTIVLVLHYKTCSFLGDYGAGKTVKTFSLLPGEKTTISIRTYKHNEEVKKRAESVLDSFTESSAQTLENIIENQNGHDETTSTEDANSFSIGGGVSAGFGPVAVNVEGGTSNSSTVTSSMADHNSHLDHALDQQVTESNSVREITVNTETSITTITDIEETITRELQNINQSRVQNYVFRQLLQEYTTITFLDDVSLVYSNGYPESKKIVKLHNLNDLLSAVLQEPAGTECVGIINKIIQFIRVQLCNVLDYTSTKQQFVECVTDTLDDCCFPLPEPIVNTYIRKKIGLSQTFEGHTVPGIITSVQKRILRTEALVADALLGQGEALDCYNMKLQDAAVVKAQLDNVQQSQQISIIDGITPDVKKAENYKSVFFKPCCDVPQCNICGCGCDCDKKTP